VRTEPPRLVHAVQRPVQRSVTYIVMQITVLPRCISALNSCSAHVTQTAIRAVAAARRAPGSGRRTPGFSWATSDALAADPFHVTPGWSDAWPEAGRRGARGLPAGVPSPILRPRTAACGRPGSIVMPMSSPRNLATRPAPRSPSPADPSRAHQCQLRMSRSFVRNGCSSVGHQCQLRTSHSFRSPVSTFSADSPVPVAHDASPFVSFLKCAASPVPVAHGGLPF
jgi:hypothetical protein